MKPIKSDDLRKSFLAYFREIKHEIVDSSPVIPQADKTLLFTNAGMNQFKDVLLGNEQRSYKRAASCQMCMRAGGKHNDLDAVGRDGRHLTFFEMLGNWSFGDYYKRDAIKWAWEYVTNVLQMPQDKLYASVYKTDDEAYDIWTKEVGLPKERVVRLGDIEKGDEENFWSMGPTGPCGPCTEIYFDLGPELGCDKPNCFVGCDCDRYSEFWNLVFMESNRLEDGSFVPLAFKSVDTGMGFERVVSIQQGKLSVFETDIFKPTLDFIKKIAKKERETPKLTKESYCVIADHIRSLTFTLAEGATFSNEGRGYVLRRILRRASRHGHLIGLDEPFLYSIVDAVIEKMGDIYPSIKTYKEAIKKEIKREEEKFLNTLERGIQYFEEAVSRLAPTGSSVLSGEEVFKLYDTFGLPADLTEIMAEEKGMKISWEEFNTHLEKQRELSRKSAKFYETNGQEERPWVEVAGGEGTEFTGYDSLSQKARIRRYRIFDDRVEVVFDKIPFYLEMGGQRSDTGIVSFGNTVIRVLDVRKIAQSTVVVCEKSLENYVRNLEEVKLIVEEEVRRRVCANHTATHLLHAALTNHVDHEANQAGSSVDEAKFTFDFKYDKALSQEQLKTLEVVVNANIRNNFEVKTSLMNVNDAMEAGATALFGDKYGDVVRVVTIGEDVSKELCGGTHVSRTGEIGAFVIESEKSIGNGIRRITAFTGEVALDYYNEAREAAAKIKELFTTATTELPDRVTKVYQENQKNLKEILNLRRSLALYELKSQQVEKSVKNLKVVFHLLKDYNRDELIEVASSYLEGETDKLIVLASHFENKTLLCIKSSDKMQGTLNVGKMLTALSGRLGGKGGGRPNLASGSVDKIIHLQEVIEVMEPGIGEFIGA